MIEHDRPEQRRWRTSRALLLLASLLPAAVVAEPAPASPHAELRLRDTRVLALKAAVELRGDTAIVRVGRVTILDL